jgi:outer membrane protein OmpU
MKHTLLATTALVAMTGAAAAELTISGTGRIGLKTTEGSAATTTAAVAGAWVAAEATTAGQLATVYPSMVKSNSTTTLVAETGFSGAGATDDADASQMRALIAVIENNIAANTGATSAEQAAMASDLAAAKFLLAEAMGTAQSSTAAVADSTDAVNRFRISFKGTGETDGGISYGISGRAEQSNSALAGTQYVSGAFGKIKMGDLGGADKDATGNISGVGLTGLGDHNEVAYQAATHNVGYEYSMSGLTLGYSQNTAVKTGSNSAMGVKYSGDMGGTGVTVGFGQSKVGDSTQTTFSASVSSGGLTIKAISSTNDQGPTDAAVAQVARGTAALGAATAWVQGSAEVANNDVDTTGLSISYTMDALTATAYTKTVSEIGTTDKDYSGLGFAYNMGGVTLKAGVVDNNDQQLIDFGLSFSF